MRLGALIQARMGSSRFPGKVLAPLGGRPVLDLLLERLRRADRLDLIAIVTSTVASDDPIEEFARERDVRCHRGSLDDVLGRFVEGAERFGLSAVVRVNGDSPFLDPRLVSQGASTFLEGGSDLVTNIFPRSFPVGQSVEVVLAEALRIAHAATAEPSDREHVTPYFYARPESFRIRNFTAEEGDFSAETLAIDNPEDLVKLGEAVRRMDRAPAEYGWREVLAIEQESSRSRAGGGEASRC